MIKSLRTTEFIDLLGFLFDLLLDLLDARGVRSKPLSVNSSQNQQT
jgi:hypothetical protein